MNVSILYNGKTKEILTKILIKVKLNKAKRNANDWKTPKKSKVTIFIPKRQTAYERLLHEYSIYKIYISIQIIYRIYF